MRTASSKNRSNKKPGLGRVFRVRCRLRSGGLQRLDARGQAALVASGLVAVDQAPRAEAVEDRLGEVERGHGTGGGVESSEERRVGIGWVRRGGTWVVALDLQKQKR